MSTPEKEIRRFRKATIKDVAAHAGVSTTTVSYFVSGKDTVCAPETARRIREAIDFLHYTPNSLTGGLRRRQTRTLGQCVTHPFDPGIVFNNIYFERLLRGIMSQADATGYALLRYPAEARNTENSAVFLDGRVDGLIFGAGYARHAPMAVQAGMPTVVLSRSRHVAAAGAGCVFANEAMTLDRALSHLWSLGHRRIAHVSGPGASLDSADWHTAETNDVAMGRLEGYVAWMRERGAYDPVLVARGGSWQGLENPEVVADWHRMEDRPTAVVCANDRLAVGVMEQAARLGWHVARELSVVGVDNFPVSLTCTPALTTVDVPLEAIGRAAVQALIDLIEGAPLEQCRVSVPVTDIVVRGTTAPVSSPR